MTTPVAVFLFDQPERTVRVLREVARVRPTRLFLIADGPRAGDASEAQRCLETRIAATQAIDWRCEVYRDFNDSHLGDTARHVSGLTWLFEQAEEAIILEGGCTPHPDFFRFAAEMLRRYREDRRVMHVNGTAEGRDGTSPGDDYSFTDFNEFDGWATWRRAWRHFDLTVGLWPDFRARRGLHALFPHRRRLRQHFESKFQAASAFLDRPMLVTWWQPQWAFACWANHGLGIAPAKTLVRTSSDEPDSAWFSRALLPARLQHPPFVIKDPARDLHYLDRVLIPRLSADTGHSPALRTAPASTPSGGSSSANSDFACARTSAV